MLAPSASLAQTVPPKPWMGAQDFALQPMEKTPFFLVQIHMQINVQEYVLFVIAPGSDLTSKSQEMLR